MNTILVTKPLFHSNCCRSQRPRGLRRRSTAARLLGLCVRIPPGVWMSVCCECCVLMSGRGLCDELATRPEESYRLWCVVVCDPETSWMKNHAQSMWLSLNRRCITGCISYMPLIVTVKQDCWMSSDRLQWYWEIKKIPTAKFIQVHIRKMLKRTHWSKVKCKFW